MKTKLGCYAAALVSSLGTAALIQAASTIQFGATTFIVAESAGTAALSVQRTADTNTEVTVDYVTVDGTATKGVKYTAVSGTLAFGPGDTNKTIAVPIQNEGIVEGTKTFRVILSNPTGGALLGTRTNVSVSITDNDVGIEFQFATSTVAEDAGVVLLGVVRGDDGTLPVTVNFATADLTASGGLDYAGVTNTLSFAPQERLKFVPLYIINNTLKQPNRVFRATLASSVGASLGGQTTASVTIRDNDQGFQFGSATSPVVEDAGAALISVLRGTDDTNSALTVDCATSDGSATNGQDYVGITNTLSFAPGDRVKLVSIPILNNGLKQPNRSFHLTLANPSGGAVLGSPTSTTVSILDNDSGVGFERTAYTNAWSSAGGITVTVLRGNDWALGPITVDYATTDLTARAGVDYQAVSGTLEFQMDESVKTLAIPLLQARPARDARSFRVTLSNATGGAVLGTSSTTVSIVGAYFTVAPPFETALTMQQVGGLNILIWAGAGRLQRADRPMGPWQTLTTATSPYAVQSPMPTTFYRVTRPRSASLYVPSGYDGQTPAPIVILLHHLLGSGADQEAYMQFRPLAEARGFLYCYPDGTAGLRGETFWNATDACCDFGSTGVDDAGYLRGLIEEIGRQFAIDRKRIYLIGHSNGSYMAYRMACQSADLIAGIASLVGVTFLDPDRCQPAGPVNILHIHGTADETIPYAGGALTSPTFAANMPAFPGAMQTVEMWAKYNGARDPVIDPSPSMDLDLAVAGLDTVITRFTNHAPGGAVELWTINRGLHFPTFYNGNSSSEFAPRVIDWLLSHPKP